MMYYARTRLSLCYGLRESLWLKMLLVGWRICIPKDYSTVTSLPGLVCGVYLYSVFTVMMKLSG